MNYKYNELDYAKLVYEKGFQTNHIPTEMRLAASYMKTVLGYKPKQLRDEMYRFCAGHIPDFNRARYYKTINCALARAAGSDSVLIKIEQIEISQYEIEFFNQIVLADNEGVILSKEYDCRKLMFTLFVQTKLHTLISEYKKREGYSGLYFKGDNKKYNELKKIAKLPIKTKINEDIIYQLSKCHMVSVLFNGLIKLDFIELLPQWVSMTPSMPCRTKRECIVKDFESIGWYFDYYNNIPKMKLCKYCGQPFKQTRSNLLYCPSHKGYQPIGYKTILCVDCGCEVTVDAKDNHTCRCETHYKEYRKNYKAEKERERRKRMKLQCVDNTIEKSKSL